MYYKLLIQIQTLLNCVSKMLRQHIYSLKMQLFIFRWRVWILESRIKSDMCVC